MFYDDFENMTVAEFAKGCRSRLRCISAYNGKILCYEYNAEKHTEIGERKILSVWADILVTDSGFGNYAVPILCAYVDGAKEYAKEKAKGE